MPWRSVLPMEERVRFIMEVLNKQLPLAEWCRRFGISRRIGYKWLARYQAEGVEGLRERSRRPWHSPRQTPRRWEERVLALRQQHPHWGPKKLAALLRRRFPRSRRPAISTVGVILQRHGLIPARRRRHRHQPPCRAALSQPTRPHQVWTVDFKGWFRTGDGRRCDPLTVGDLFSRYLLAVEVLPDQSRAPVQRIFERLFATYGLPEKIRCDNGSPFASRGAGGLSRLSVWWMLRGIEVELIERGCPQQNGAHERMHLTLKQETTQPPAAHRGAQQRRFGSWRRQFNEERPHEALGMKVPAQLYRRQAAGDPRPLRPPEYPADGAQRRVRHNGQIKWQGRKRFVGEAFAGVLVAIQTITRGRHQVRFGSVLLGELHDGETGGLRPAVSLPSSGRNKSNGANGKPGRG